MDVKRLEGADAEAAAAAAEARLDALKQQLKEAGARSFEGVFIDADGVARSIDMEDSGNG